MMVKSILLALLTLCAHALSAQPRQQAPADVIVLRNGDRLTGELVSLVGGKVRFHSPILGDLEIALEDLADLRTASPVTVVSKDGGRIHARITGFAKGAVVLGPGPGGAGPQPKILLARLAMINPPRTPAVAWTGSVNVGASILSGNTERRAIHAAAEVKRRTKTDRVTADLSWDFAEEKNRSGGDFSLTDRRLGGGLKYDYFLSKKSYVLGAVHAENDTLADVELRYTAGGGYGHQWLENDRVVFSTEAGVSYFYEDYRVNSGTQSYISGRLSYDLFFKLTDDLKLLQKLEYLPSLENKDDLYIKLDSRLQLSLTEKMFSQLQWVVNYDNTPSPGLDRVDHRFNLSIGWSF